LREKRVKRTIVSSHLNLVFSSILLVWMGTVGCSEEDGVPTVDGGDNFLSKSIERTADLVRGSDSSEEQEGVQPSSTAGQGAGRDLEKSESPSLIYTRKYYNYRTTKSQDPFQPLLREGERMEGLSLNTLILTGIMWDNQNSMVVMEDSRGKGYSMRVGDRLAGAKLVAIRKDAAVFRVVEFGEVHSVVKELFVKERPI
jgi:hypothetical protein